MLQKLVEVASAPGPQLASPCTHLLLVLHQLLHHGGGIDYLVESLAELLLDHLSTYPAHHLRGSGPGASPAHLSVPASAGRRAGS